MSMLRLRELVKTYTRRGARVLDGVSFSVDASECVAVLGKSGCGKSTLARCVAGLESLTSGGVEIEGHRHNPHDREQRRRVQMVWQDCGASLSPFLDIWDSLRETGIQEAQLAELARGAGFREELLSRRPHQLSGGELQRAGIARALAGDPKVLILDEPLSALDPMTQFEILPYLRQATHAAGRAALLISHDLTAVRQLADRVVFLNGGKVVEDRPAHEFLLAPQHPAAQAFVSAWPDLPF